MMQEKQRQGLMLLSRCMQKPGNWLTERITSGQLIDSLQHFFPETDCLHLQHCSPPCPLTDLLAWIASVQDEDPIELQRNLSRQYHRWTAVETNTMSTGGPPSPFTEAQDPLGSYRHLPGQEIMEWYHCCGMKMPKRFVGRPDSIHMKLEFAVYLTGIISQHPDDPDHIKTYEVFLRRFLLPHTDRILHHRCGREQFPFYYMLCSLIRWYLT